MKKLEQASVVLGVVATLIAAGIYLGSMQNDITRLKADLSRLEEKSADQLCLNLVSRQIAAIETRRVAVQSKLHSMADEYGCIRRYGSVVGGSVEATEAEILQREAEVRKRRDRFAAELHEIDNELGRQ